MSQFQTFKSDLAKSRITTQAKANIHNNEILVRIEKYAFTANNITYGVAGDTIGYWKFFPAADDERKYMGLYTHVGIWRGHRIKLR
jgi:hypothetical protein